MSKITHDKIRQLEFNVYKAKDFYNSQWLDKYLKEQTANARKSFLRYGHVPAFDVYDTKAAVYIASVKDGDTTEWLSIRFVPGAGFPKGTSDLEECLFNGQTARNWLTVDSELFGDYDNFLSQIVSISKICGFSESGKNNIAEYWGLKYTLKLFVLINKHFIADALESNLPFYYIMGLFRDELIKKKLTFEVEDTHIPRFTPTHKTLGLPANKVCLNRNSLAYQFPAYFLEMEDVRGALQELVANNKISKKTIEYYLGHKIDIDEPWISGTFLKNRQISRLKNLGRFLITEGKLRDSSMTGEQLRRFLDLHVRDGAKSKMMKFESWQQDIKKLANILRV